MMNKEEELLNKLIYDTSVSITMSLANHFVIDKKIENMMLPLKNNEKASVMLGVATRFMAYMVNSVDFESHEDAREVLMIMANSAYHMIKKFGDETEIH